MGGHGVLLPRGPRLVRGTGWPHGPVVLRGPDVQLVLAQVRPGAAGLQLSHSGWDRSVRGPSRAVLPAARPAVGLPLPVEIAFKICCCSLF